jgi:chromosome segregation ATPase
MNDMEQRLAASRSQLQRCKQALLSHKTQEDELQIKLQRLDDQVEELTDALERDNVEDGRLDVLKATLQEGEEEKRVNQGSFDESVAAMSAIMNKLKASRRELASKDAEIAAQEEHVKIAESENSNVKEQRRRALAEKNAAVMRVDDLKQARSRIANRREEIVARILEYSEQAKIVSPRVAVDEGETPNSLDQKLDRLHRDLEHFNKQSVSLCHCRLGIH